MNFILSCRLRSASKTPLMPSPGSPKMTSTPQSNNFSTKTSDAVICNSFGSGGTHIAARTTPPKRSLDGAPSEIHSSQALGLNGAPSGAARAGTFVESSIQGLYNFGMQGKHPLFVQAELQAELPMLRGSTRPRKIPGTKFRATLM